MALRDEIRAEQLAQLVESPEVDVTVDNDRLTLINHVQPLCGQLTALSDCAPVPIVVRAQSYPSVMHFVYARLLRALRLPAADIDRLRTVVSPCDVARVAERTIRRADVDTGTHKYRRLLDQLPKWKRRAVTVKLESYALLKRLLLTTGQAILVDSHRPCGSRERDVQHLLTKPYCDAATIVQWMQCSPRECPATIATAFNGNGCGLLLMRLRARLQSLCDAQQLAAVGQARLVALPTLASYAALVSQHLVCFTAASHFHPLHAAEVVVGARTYPSAQHYVLCEAVDYFGVKAVSKEELCDLAPLAACRRLAQVFAATSRPPVEQLHAWAYTDQLEALRRALRARFEQHPSACRALLDTGDALLVYCSRGGGASLFADGYEWSAAMRETDVRAWMAACRMSSGQLIDLMCAPPARRPAMLGGNRLGMLLLELRKEFRLRLGAAQADSLPPMAVTQTPEMVLGSDSPMENVDVFDWTQEGQVDDPQNVTQIWASECGEPLM